MESNDHLIGKQLGTCVLEQVIGSGGMGVVYLAHQTRPVRDVAVKVLRSGAGIYSEAHQEFLARFRREANVIAQLDHVNILPIYEYAEQDGLAYLVMPYLKGGSLRTLLEKQGRLSPLEAFKYIEQAGSALQYAHEHNIVHRDIKPGNMLFHADGRLVLVDFGIARITRDSSVSNLSDPSLTAVGQFLGSVEYMAPEMVQGHNVDYRADLYELGIVLFQMLTGRLPFQGGSPLFIAAMHINEQPPSLLQLNPGISLALNAVVQKAIAKDPAARYQSAREMVAAVRQAIGVSNAIAQGLYTESPVHVSHPISSPEAFHPHSSYPPANSHPSAPNYSPVDASQAGYAPNTPYGDMPNTSISYPSNAPQGQIPYTQPVGSGQTPYGGSSYPAVNAHSYSQGLSPHYDLQEADTAFSQYVEPRKSSAWKGWLLAIVVIVALCVVGVIFGPRIIEGSFGQANQPTPTQQVRPTAVPTTPSTPEPTATPTPVVVTADTARAFVQSYFDDINQRNYKGAYDHWAKDYRDKNSYDQFVSGFAHTSHDDVTITDVAAGDNGSYKVSVHFVATEVDDTGATVMKNFQGTYIVGIDQGAQHLLSQSRVLPA
ncbi:serine/threonine-protein kinase [Dictyobacter formicarum]|uniref:non-specific serine/threonine protein kinase n=1 Tax=Dictyobacter formicarum TaxID=2778368 RepID=A0ABQ3VF70_9CHLR|nr:serine/threonine-protein kinase [Dictyobacter formicarum]GHO84293.1 hypothetical protein KSZ_22990 [Dictyobacter formicarum]